MDCNKITLAQRVLKDRVDICVKVSAECRNGEPGEWRLVIAKNMDMIADELRDVLRVLEAVGA